MPCNVFTSPVYTQDIQNTFNVHVFGLAKERMYMKTHICSQVLGTEIFTENRQ